jgi:hypothetical protein
LSIDDTLATYILFVKSCESGYDDLRSHVAALPASYTSSIFFAEAELEVCAGTSLYTATKQLDRQIKDDYRGLVARLFGRHQELFPPDKFTIEDVGITTHEKCCESVTNTYFLSFSISGLSAPYGVVLWIFSCPMEIRFDFWPPSRTC